jgi:hypothetical protein
MNLQLKQLDRGENKCREEEIMRIFNIIKNTKLLVVGELEVGSIIVDTCNMDVMLVTNITDKYICYHSLSELTYHTNWEGEQLTVKYEHLFNNYIYKVYKYNRDSFDDAYCKITKTSLSKGHTVYRHYSNNNNEVYKIETNIFGSYVGSYPFILNEFFNFI